MAVITAASPSDRLEWVRMFMIIDFADNAFGLMAMDVARINELWSGVELGNSNHPCHRGADGERFLGRPDPRNTLNGVSCTPMEVKHPGPTSGRMEEPLSTVFSPIRLAAPTSRRPSRLPSRLHSPPDSTHRSSPRIRSQSSSRSLSASACNRSVFASPRDSASRYQRHPSSKRPNRTR